MTLTPAQIEAIEKLIAAARPTAHIAQKFGVPLAAVTAYRAERKSRVRREKAKREWVKERAERQDLPRGYFRDTGTGIEDDGSLLTVLQHMVEPLTSLSDRVAALGIPVLVRRAA